MTDSASKARLDYEEAKNLFSEGDEYEAILDAAVLALMVVAQSQAMDKLAGDYAFEIKQGYLPDDCGVDFDEIAQALLK